MKLIKKALLPATLLCGALAMAAANPALADRGHRHGGPRVSFGFVIGGPIWPYPYGYYPRPYYYPPAVIVPSSPPVYVEQSQAPAASEPASGAYWYFCDEAKAYYPYVKSCPGGWQRVAPQPQ